MEDANDEMVKVIGEIVQQNPKMTRKDINQKLRQHLPDKPHITDVCDNKKGKSVSLYFDKFNYMLYPSCFICYFTFANCMNVNLCVHVVWNVGELNTKVPLLNRYILLIEMNINPSTKKARNCITRMFKNYF